MKLNNDYLMVEINSLGAELKSIHYQEVEYVWQGDPMYWKRSSPVLFPIVGRLLDNEYIYNGKTYALSQHGFARDHEFVCVKSTNLSATFKLTSNENTLQKYPFLFELFITYKLEDTSIHVEWDIVNLDNKNMLFQIGAHPAFNFLNESIVQINKKTNQYLTNGTPYVEEVQKDVAITEIKVDDDTFKNDALIFEHIDSVVLKDENKEVHVSCSGFPFLGLWTSVIEGKNAPFICIEPWHGIADFKTHDKKLENKVGINKLEPGKKFKTAYTITVK